MRSGWWWPSNEIIQTFTTKSSINVLRSYCGIQQVITYLLQIKWQVAVIKKASLLAKHCLFTLRAHASGSLFFMGKSFIWRFPVLLGFSSLQSNKNSCCCGILGFFCLQPQLRLGCVRNGTRMGTHRCKASDTAAFSRVTQERRLANGPTVTVIAGCPFWTAPLPGNGGTAWSNLCLIWKKMPIPTQEADLNFHITCDRKL